MRPAGCPLHLLLLHHAFADHLVHESAKKSGVGQPIPPLLSEIQVATTNAGARTARRLDPRLFGALHVDLHCYLPMDRLLERQNAIQRTLAARHLQDGHLVLYDITSRYFEGDYTQSDIVTFGYNRDGKRGHEQMVIALLCSAEGCPVGVEVFAGNTQDAST